MTAPICAKCGGEMAVVIVRHRTGLVTRNPLCSNGHRPTGRQLVDGQAAEPVAPVLKLIRAIKEAS